jgi:hypothetical protein
MILLEKNIGCQFIDKGWPFDSCSRIMAEAWKQPTRMIRAGIKGKFN